MSEKSISERAKETLIWIQKEQKNTGLGMVEFAKVPDQGAVRYLLRMGDVFEPQPGMVKSSVEPPAEETVSATGEASEFTDHTPWVWKTPKPKSKKDKPEPYEFLAYPEWDAMPSVVAEALRGMGFAGDPFLYEGYSYRKMAGGALRRKMIGTHSKEALLAEFKLKEGLSDTKYKKFEQDVTNVISSYRGKYKEFPHVAVCSDIVYYPKDGSFSFKKPE
ncbi:MAG TPA: hypothetical protein VLH35_06670 [Candidatus Acidoferrales bacterium]|nr:hypothetical protein [Candidatus Acidoferrales bacterium]